MEVGLAVVGAFLSSALNVLIDRIAPQGDLLNMFRTRTNDVRILEKLEDILLGLQAVLSDAENKQASNQFVRQWLNELRDAVDSAENLIEQVNYEALRHEVEGKHQTLAKTLLKRCRICFLCLGDDFFLKIKDKLEETIERLQNLQKQIRDLGLIEHSGSPKQETRTPSTSLVDDSDIFGRQKEIEDLIDRLLSEDANGKNLAVVPIVGMGGLGKTTLAQVVYNNEKVQNHFPLKAWVCVSEAYDALRITKGLLQEIGSFDPKDDNNLNKLQVKLKESIKGKKFLVVLDDVWNDNYSEWDDLRNIFVQGDMGSKIIVTTRMESVAKMMGNEQISMEKLSTEVSWSLFRRHAFENMDPMEHPELEEVGKQIAAKCKGLPLALKTLGGMLRSKSEVEEWKRILRSQIWELPHSGILPELMLSYNDLPAHLKRCFSYCAIFPKDYPFRKEQVVHLWIANGLVPQEDEKIEDSGNRCFLELRSRSLLERVPNPSEGNIQKFLMHDLVNDLAQLASSKLCIRLEESQGSHMLEKSRHLSYSIGYGGDFEKLTPLYNLEQLRTLLPTYSSYSHPLSKRVLHNILPTLRSLRALSLSRYNIKELPNHLFIKLKLLRFLDLSETMIEKLPDSICVLYNLVTLLLSSCANLEELPLQMKKLINLRHLDISNTPRLTLERCDNLTWFLIPPETEKLEIKRCENVELFLVASWGPQMTSLHIYGLKLKCLPEGMQELLPSLKELELYCCPEIESFPEGGLPFNLQVLKILNCTKLVNGRKEWRLPCLRELWIVHDGSDEDIKHWELPSSIQRLSVYNLKTLSSQLLKSLTSLEYLNIAGNLPEIHSLLEEGKLPSSLSQLTIWDCPNLKSLSESALTSSLSQLYIWDCPNLKSLSESSLPSSLSHLIIENCHNLQSLSESALPSSLSHLIIWECPNLQSLPVKGMPSSLSELSIRDCPLLRPQLEFDKGEYWPNIAQIPIIEIDEEFLG